jgi:hypothetical protein
MNEYKSTSFIPRERIEKRGREGLDGRVWGHCIVCVGVRSVCLPAGGAREDSMATYGDRKTNKLVHQKVGPAGNLVLTRGGRARQHFHRSRRSAAAVQDAGRVREQGARPRTSPPPP